MTLATVFIWVQINFQDLSFYLSTTENDVYFLLFPPAALVASQSLLCVHVNGLSPYIETHTNTLGTHEGRHTHTHYLRPETSSCYAHKALKITCQTGRFKPEGWMWRWSRGDRGRCRRRWRGSDRRPLKSRLKCVAHLIPGESHTNTGLDYGFHHLGGCSAHRRQDLHLHSWRVLHPWVCEFSHLFILTLMFLEVPLSSGTI